MARPRNHPQVFVAIVPPAVAVRRWHALLDGNLGPAGSPVEVDQTTLTVQYVGGVPVRALDEVEESVRRAAAGIPPFVLSAIRIASLPADAPTRQVAVITSAPSPLIELKRRLVHRLARNRRQPKEAYVPRIPLVRFPSPVTDWSLALDLTDAPFDVTELLLLETQLGAQGSTQRMLMRVGLGL